MLSKKQIDALFDIAEQDIKRVMEKYNVSQAEASVIMMAIWAQKREELRQSNG